MRNLIMFYIILSLPQNSKTVLALLDHHCIIEIVVHSFQSELLYNKSSCVTGGHVELFVLEGTIKESQGLITMC